MVGNTAALKGTDIVMAHLSGHASELLTGKVDSHFLLQSRDATSFNMAETPRRLEPPIFACAP